MTSNRYNLLTGLVLLLIISLLYVVHLSPMPAMVRFNDDQYLASKNTVPVELRKYEIGYYTTRTGYNGGVYISGKSTRIVGSNGIDAPLTKTKNAELS